ncbi:uncharacterized protein LOC119685759 [Teleopsis dalmanni]|uniref:uncharacterized protein LOC119685759 n=1 Tax=Teleopsis dalmanni TaxID=139649 RepID=UPI0018CDE3F5|nr:uncharacterized protein LOC119685759 [Teleopsis dalmanni]
MVFVKVVVLSFCLLNFCFVKTQGRQAIKPCADVEDIVKDLSGLHINQADNSNLKCTLDIQKDLSKPHELQPLYIVPNRSNFWQPNLKGQIEIPHGASIELYCTKSFANATDNNSTLQKIPKNTRTLKPLCLQDKTFILHGEKFEFQQFVCTRPVRYTVERTSKVCTENGAHIYRVGFNITKQRFIETMKICHNDNLLSTHYTQHMLLPGSLHYQKYVKRLNFSKAGYFNDYNVQFLYSRKNQNEKAVTLLEGNHAQYFDNSSFFLSRGHLAAKADFIYASQQRSTFTFLNVAPQWQSFNAGQWETMEDAVRKFIGKSQLEVDCYTGTHGVMELTANGGNKRLFYLAYDANNNGILPVPKLYYRVIVDRKNRKRGIALVGVNNPHVTNSELQNVDGYILCDDVREQVPWLRWIRNDKLTKGYMYACRVNEFASVVEHLPKQLLSVKELLIE